MTTPAAAILDWKGAPETHPHGPFRPLVEFDSWMPPINDDFQGDTFGPFEATMLPLKSHKGLSLYPLVSCWDACEAYQAREGASGFGDRGGWEMFGAPWEGAQGLWIDPGTPQEMVIEKVNFPQLKALAEAVAVECAWKRIHKGNQQPGDMALVVNYGGYHLAAVQGPDGVRVLNVPHDDDGMFIPLFTHADALALAMPEFQRDSGDTVQTTEVTGRKLFPPLVNESAKGIVFNYLGPTDPLAFSLKIIELLLEEIARNG